MPLTNILGNDHTPYAFKMENVPEPVAAAALAGSLQNIPDVDVRELSWTDRDSTGVHSV